MEIKLLLPDGTPAFRTEIGLATLDVATLELRIEVYGYDLDGNKMATILVPYKISEIREVGRLEIEKAVFDHFNESNKS